MSKVLTRTQLQSLREEVDCLIGGWLNDHEVVENTDDYQNEVFRIFVMIAEMIERWDEYTIEYKKEIEEDDNADYLYESEVGK